MKTKERITEEALKLFAEHGYKGTSVKQIADAVGIKDASLYKHFDSKQEIFQSIVELIASHTAELSKKLGIPDGTEYDRKTAEFFRKVDTEGLKKLLREAFLFYLKDPYLSKFWRISHIEQYSHPEIYELFRYRFIDSAISYHTTLFQGMSQDGIINTKDPRAAAISFYAPFFLLLTQYENQPDEAEAALEVLDKHVDEFFRVYGKNKGKAEV